MERWKVNLAVLWIGQFLVLSGMTMIIPFLPLYIQELGVTDPDQVAFWAGVIFAANFLTAFIFQPIWGKLADRYGRKVMILRSGFGMALVMTLMGFSMSVWHLFWLRVLNGVISGFIPAAVALIAATAPKERMGFAMGTLQSGAVAGSILGPLFGGVLAELFGFRPIFYITGTLLFAATFLAMFLVKENFDPSKAKLETQMSIIEGFQQLRIVKQLPILFTVSMVIQFAIQSSNPLMPLFVQEIHGAEYLAFFAGLVASVAGFSNMISAPILGKYSDRIGAEIILAISLLGAALTFIPQVFVTNIWQLLVARFFFGIFIGGLLPTVNSLIRKYTPDGMEGRAYSFNTSFLSIGNLIGPIIGGMVSYAFNIRSVFGLASVILLFNFLWVVFALLPSAKLKKKSVE